MIHLLKNCLIISACAVALTGCSVFGSNDEVVIDDADILAPLPTPVAIEPLIQEPLPPLVPLAAPTQVFAAPITVPSVLPGSQILPINQSITEIPVAPAGLPIVAPSGLPAPTAPAALSPLPQFTDLNSGAGAQAPLPAPDLGDCDTFPTTKSGLVAFRRNCS